MIPLRKIASLTFAGVASLDLVGCAATPYYDYRPPPPQVVCGRWPPYRPQMPPRSIGTMPTDDLGPYPISRDVPPPRIERAPESESPKPATVTARTPAPDP